MTEPNYVYKKGEGWVIEPPYKTYTRIIYDYEVTIENRKPEPHERFYAESHDNLERIMDAIQNWHSHLLDNLGNPYSRIAEFPSSHFDNKVWITVKARKL